MKTIQGSIPAILTPMQDDGSLDLPGLQRLLDWHIAEGTDGVVIVGTTGESPTVNYDEHCALIETTVKHVAGRIPVIAGTGANSTSEAIELAHFARKAGADAHLSVVPYYNKPTQEGLYRHFRRSPRRSICPCFFTTCRDVRLPISPTTRHCALHRCRA
jgi:4-hydroxy-tetrahydrodipicolinate synthase